MRTTVAALVGALAVIGGVLAATGPALAAHGAAVKPKITFRSDGKGWYIVTTTPPSPLKATLVGYYECDLSGTNCAGSDVIDVEVLPKAARHRVSWGIAKFWEQPDGDDSGGLYPGTYKVIMAIPGTKVSQSATYKINPGGD
jgi:hypothetical protein